MTKRVIIHHDIDIPDWLAILAETLGLFLILGLGPGIIMYLLFELVLKFFA